MKNGAFLHTVGISEAGQRAPFRNRNDHKPAVRMYGYTAMKIHFSKGDNFVTHCLHSWTMQLFKIGCTLKGKNLILRVQKFFLLELTPDEMGGKKLCHLSSEKVWSSLLPILS